MTILNRLTVPGPNRQTKGRVWNTGLNGDSHVVYATYAATATDAAVTKGAIKGASFIAASKSRPNSQPASTKAGRAPATIINVATAKVRYNKRALQFR